VKLFVDVSDVKEVGMLWMVSICMARCEVHDVIIIFNIVCMTGLFIIKHVGYPVIRSQCLWVDCFQDRL
jgi:hypothetical protein